MSHVPWLGAMIVSRLWLFPDYRKIRRYMQERALRRIKEGSNIIDLFHHLVCSIFRNVFKMDIHE